MIRCVVFDFDGTLVLSNEIKRDGFFAVIPTSTDARTEMEAILRAPPGDRNAILGMYARRCGGDSERFVDEYTRWCAERIVVCRERLGAGEALRALRAQGIPIHINSATPELPLRQVVARRYGADVFASVRGGYGAKQSILHEIVRASGGSSESVVMVGDGTDDLEAAKAVGCRFFGVSGGSLAESSTEVDLMEDLSFLPSLIGRYESAETLP